MIQNGRGGGIRTPDPLLPKQMRYQAALRPDTFLLDTFLLDTHSIVTRNGLRTRVGRGSGGIGSERDPVVSTTCGQAVETHSMLQSIGNMAAIVQRQNA